MQRTAKTLRIHKAYERRLPLDAFEKFVPCSKGKLVSNHCFKHVIGEAYKQIFQVKEQHKKYIERKIEKLSGKTCRLYVKIKTFSLAAKAPKTSL